MARKDSACMLPSKVGLSGSSVVALAVHVLRRLHSSHEEVGSIAVGVGLHASTLSHCMLFCMITAACSSSMALWPFLSIPPLHCSSTWLALLDQTRLPQGARKCRIAVKKQCNSAQDKYCTGPHMSRGLPRRPAAQPSSRISARRPQNLPPRLDSFSQVDSASHLHNGATPTDHGQPSAVLPKEACSSCFCGPSHPPSHTLHAQYSGYLNVYAHASMSTLDVGATVQAALAALPRASRRHAPRKRVAPGRFRKRVPKPHIPYCP